MNVYIRIELLARELQGRLLLALVAAERGHEVLLGKLSHRLFESRSRRPLPPGVFHDKSLGVTDSKRAYHGMLRERGILITAQDEEHGLAEESFDSMAVRFDEDAMSRTALLFAWGPFDKRSLDELLPNCTDRIVMTGSPRVDFWRPEFRGLLRGRAPLRSSAPVILFVASGGEQVFETPPLWEVLSESSSVDERLIASVEWMGASAVYTAQARCAIEAMARAFPSAHIVVRPHPAGYPGAWERLLRFAPPNVTVRTDNAVSPWLESSSVIVTNGSTVAFEVAISGRVGIAFVPGGYDHASEANRVLQRATSVPELIEMVRSQLSARDRDASPPPESSRGAGLEDRFSALTGRLAADRIVDLWESTAPDGGRTDLLAAVRGITGAQGARARVRSTISSSRWRRGSPRQKAVEGSEPLSHQALKAKFPAFAMEEIESLKEDLASTLGRFSEVEVTLVHDRLLHLRRIDGRRDAEHRAGYRTP